MKIIRDIIDADFNAAVITAKLPVVVMCTSPECIICKTMHERLKEVGREFEGRVSFLSLNVNKNEIWRTFDVRAIPTLLYFRGGQLYASHYAFPEKEEIAATLQELLEAKGAFIEQLTKAIDAEYIISRFYKYIAHETKNGKVKAIFAQCGTESEGHRNLLEEKFTQLTGRSYFLDTSKFESADIKPQSFSLMGAIKTAIETEEQAFQFYKTASREAPDQLRDTFKRLIKEETGHFRILKKELQFLKVRERLPGFKELDYLRWMPQAWK